VNLSAKRVCWCTECTFESFGRLINAGCEEIGLSADNDIVEGLILRLRELQSGRFFTRWRSKQQQLALCR
jgi:hypothetical protein